MPITRCREPWPAKHPNTQTPETPKPTDLKGHHERKIQCLRNGPGAVRPRGRPAQPRAGGARAAALAHARVPLHHPGAHGRRDGQGLPRLPRPAQRPARAGQGRHPLPPPGDGRHRARAGHLDDLEVRAGRHPARRRQGRGHLRPAPDVPPRAGAGLPRLGAPGVQERRAAARRPGPGRHDQRPAHALDAGRVRGPGRGPLPGVHHRQAGRHGRLARPARGDRLSGSCTACARRCAGWGATSRG